MLLIHSFILSFRFDLQLDNFGVDINELKKPATEKVFVLGWKTGSGIAFPKMILCL